MSRGKRILIFTGFIALLFSCKPYNSDEANHKLIQGKWMLVDVERGALDSVKVDYYKQVTYLTFEGNKCSQQMIDLNEVSNYSFSIRDFRLDLYSDSLLSSSLNIDMLTTDSLILSKGNNSVWKYIKK